MNDLTEKEAELYQEWLDFYEAVGVTPGSPELTAAHYASQRGRTPPYGNIR